jgi:hypothetical protein
VATERGDELVDRLQRGASDDSANELLKEMFAGYPTDPLRQLIHSREPIAVKSAAWILSELAYRAPSIMSELSYLLDHPLRDARFWAVDAVLGSARNESGETIAMAIALIADQDEAVRWKVLQLLARAPLTSLTAGAIHLNSLQLRGLVNWLTTVAPDSSAGVTARLASSDHLERMFAAAAAARLAPSTRSPLVDAAGSEDREVSSFAKDELALPHP